MIRRWRIVLGLALLVALTAMFAHPAIYWPVAGWLRGEAFYQGRPTSYWSQAIWTWANDSAAGTWLDQARVSVGMRKSDPIPRPPVIGDDPGPYSWHPAPANMLALRPTEVDPAALPVLLELLGEKRPQTAKKPEDGAGMPVLVRQLLRDKRQFVRIQAALAIMTLARDGKISDADACAFVGEELLFILECPFSGEELLFILERPFSER
jgi:hypothetical protein